MFILLKQKILDTKIKNTENAVIKFISDTLIVLEAPLMYKFSNKHQEFGGEYKTWPIYGGA